jgi:predicted metal-binding membrane protein
VPLGCAIGNPNQDTSVENPMDSYSFVSFFGAAFMAAKAMRYLLGSPSSTSSSDVTSAVALNLAGMQHGFEQPSERCLCRCSHPIVQEYRFGKYIGKLRGDM